MRGTLRCAIARRSSMQVTTFIALPPVLRSCSRSNNTNPRACNAAPSASTASGMNKKTPLPDRSEKAVRVGLFVPCLVDLIRPKIGFAAAKLLEDAGCVVEVPLQTCCGQPAFNSGDRATARALAEAGISAFASYDYVVAPSGSCAGVIRVHYPEIFAGDPGWMPRAAAFCQKTFELTSFLVDIMKLERVDAIYEGTATYHDACSGLRELGVKAQPRKLLASVVGLSLAEMKD